MARPGLSLTHSLGQHQLLLPRMLQSIEVLQLPGAELETWLVETGPPQAEVAATTDAAASWALAPCSGRSR